MFCTGRKKAKCTILFNVRKLLELKILLAINARLPPRKISGDNHPQIITNAAEFKWNKPTAMGFVHRIERQLVTCEPSTCRCIGEKPL